MKQFLKLNGFVLVLSLVLFSCKKEDDTPVATKVDFGDAPTASTITAGAVEVITEDQVRYHVIVATGGPTVTIVESEKGIVLVDLGPHHIANLGTNLRTYADAIGKPMSVIITHNHGDHYGNIDKFTDVPIYAASTVADILKANNEFTTLYSGNITKVSSSETIQGFAFKFNTVSEAETGVNGYVYIENEKALFAGDLISNQSHNYIREYTPLEGADELTNWITGITSFKATFADYKHVFVGHNGTRTDITTVIDENIAYLTDAQGLIKGTKTLTAGGTASTNQEVVDELDALYPNYQESGLRLSLPDAFYPGDPGAVWF